MKPSDYWRRQCKATFQFDRIGAKLVDDIGAETLMWGSDYPHPDGVWPESSKSSRSSSATCPRTWSQDHLRQRPGVLQAGLKTAPRAERSESKP